MNNFNAERIIKAEQARIRAQNKRALARFYKLNSLLGNQCMFYVITGGRMTGKSYSVAEHFVKRKRELKDQCQLYWMRISETSTNAMKQGKCKGLIDPDLQRKYKLDLSSKGMYIYNHKKEFMTLLPLSQFGKLKGVGFFDKDYTGETLICLDEFQLEQGEKRTSFDILYNFIGMLENVVRTTKSKVKVFLLANTLEEASSVLKAFNFIPESFGRFYLHKWNKYTQKRELFCVIDNLEPTEEYLKDRYGSAADLLGGDRMSNYTNELLRDYDLIDKSRLTHPVTIIKFQKNPSSWYTIWETVSGEQVIKQYNKEQVKTDIAMRPHLPAAYSLEMKGMVTDMYDARAWHFRDYITQSYFYEEMEKLRKQ